MVKRKVLKVVVVSTYLSEDIFDLFRERIQFSELSVSAYIRWLVLREVSVLGRKL